MSMVRRRVWPLLCGVVAGAGMMVDSAASAQAVAPAAVTPNSTVQVVPAGVDIGQLASVARRYGSRGNVLQISLSPSGDKVAFISPLSGGREEVQVVNVAGGETASVMVAGQDGGHLDWCKWASDENLICNLYGTLLIREQVVGFTRLFVVRSDGSGSQVLTADDSHRALGLQQFGGTVLSYDVPGQANQVLMTRQYVADMRTGTLVGT